MKKSNYEKVVETVNEISRIGEEKGLGRFYTEDPVLDGRYITANGKKMVHFGSCGYLGLELDQRLKSAAIEAIHKYGTLFASSRLYASTGNYLELEELLAKMFNAYVVVTTNVSLGHHSVMPIVVSNGDLVIYDQQAHVSMHELAYKLRFMGVDIDILRHNRLDELEKKIENNKAKYNKIWYVIDGVYSMYGDFPPLHDIVKLLDKHKKLHLYMDDAHGMSWAGPNGTGYGMSQVELHDKMVMGTSIAKGFGACGGVFVFKDLELRDKVRRWGGPLTYSGPQEPATVASAIASAKIHLTDEIYEMQNKLQKKIKFCNEIMDYYKVPIISPSHSPIFFVGLGLTKMGYNMIGRILEEGYHTNIGVFPAVPETCTGMRFTVTNHIEEEDIEGLAKAIAYHLPIALKEEDRTMKDIFRAFRKFSNLEERLGSEYTSDPNSKRREEILVIKEFDSIKKLDKKIWNNYLGDRGSFDYMGLEFLETAFSNNVEKENNWDFYYYHITDTKGETILLTFFTHALNKDDMLAPANVSALIEKKRKEDKYYLTSSYLMMGTLLTNGNHLFLNQRHPLWKEAMVKLLDLVWDKQEKLKANALYLRDFSPKNTELISFLMDHGFIKIDTLENNFIINSETANIETYIESLTHKKRQTLKKDILSKTDLFDIEIEFNSSGNIKKYYQMYKNVQANNFSLNSFGLPKKLFDKLQYSNNWEILKLNSKADNKLLSVIFSYKSESSYCPIIIGLDYEAPKELNVYKQSLFQVIKRGFDLGCKNIYLGLTATETKQKLGAEVEPQIGFIQIKDHFNHDLIENMKFSTETV